MPKFIAKRAVFALIRFIGTGLVLLALVEWSFCMLGGSDRHVWDRSNYSSLIDGVMGHHGEIWKSALVAHALSSLLVVGIAYGTILIVGYGWGILGARLRRIGLIHYLIWPFSLLSNVPGFWFVTLIVTFSVYHWNRPGYADEANITEGFDFLTVWNAAIIAFPITCGLLAWQMKAVSKEICEKASEPYIKALYIRGHRSESIFYRNIFKHSLRGLIGLFDRTLSPLLGALITVEWAFHYHGLGTLLVESARASRYEGMFLVGMSMAGLIIAIAFVREIVEEFFQKKTV